MVKRWVGFGVLFLPSSNLAQPNHAGNVVLNIRRASTKIVGIFYCQATLTNAGKGMPNVCNHLVVYAKSLKEQDRHCRLFYFCCSTLFMDYYRHCYNSSQTCLTMIVGVVALSYEHHTPPVTGGQKLCLWKLWHSVISTTTPATVVKGL